jgi:hypothetical protein
MLAASAVMSCCQPLESRNSHTPFPLSWRWGPRPRGPQNAMLVPRAVAELFVYSMATSEA